MIVITLLHSYTSQYLTDDWLWHSAVNFFGSSSVTFEQLKLQCAYFKRLNFSNFYFHIKTHMLVYQT